MKKTSKFIIIILIVVFVFGLLAWLALTQRISTFIAGKYEYQGIDVSHYQGDIDWKKMQDQGISFAYIKATEGSSYVDDRLSGNYEGARATDIKYGFYHFLSFESSPQTQMDNYRAAVGDYDMELIPAIDIEWYGNLKKNPPAKETVLNALNQMADLMEQEYGKKPLVYTTQSFYRKYFKGEQLDYPLWIRNIYFSPLQNWTVWQYTDRAVLEGFAGDESFIDRDVIRKKDFENILSGMKKGEENMDTANENKALAEESFASGIAASEDSADSAAAASSQESEGFVLNNEIEERCPVTMTATRGDVKYGEFTHGTYFSNTCGLERGYNILLPADYSTDKKYPVLYLLHGIFGNEYSFSGDASNKIKEIVGNMAAEGAIEETIVVCPNMYASSDPNQQPGFDAESVLPYDNFINDLVNDLMPHIESEYSVLTGRENTYLAGFSMGGRETIFITLRRPELFGYVCAISAAPGIVPTQDKFMTHEGQISEEEMRFAEGATTPEVFIICCGTRDSVVGTYPKSYHELLEKNGTDHIWYEVTGADHDNNAIKSGLYNLFKQIAFDKAQQ